MWLNPPAGSFDSFGEAMLALFVATTGDNMPDLMYAGMDAVGPDEPPRRTDWSASALFFLAWMLVGTFIALNLFIGAIVDTFSGIRALKEACDHREADRAAEAQARAKEEEKRAADELAKKKALKKK